MHQHYYIQIMFGIKFQDADASLQQNYRASYCHKVRMKNIWFSFTKILTNMQCFVILQCIVHCDFFKAMRRYF